jgi:uracil phosphoribosyltransferase
MNKKFTNVHIIDHPLIQNKLTKIRNSDTNNLMFRTLLSEIASLMVFEIFRDFPTKKVNVVTPLEETTGIKLAKDITLVPILRAGLGMIEGILDLIPNATVGHVGLYRHKKTLQPIEYYSKFPQNIADTRVIVIDPMLATGGSASAAIDFVKKKEARDIQFVCLVAAPEGISKLKAGHPDVPIYTAAIDRELNNQAYIMPGLGDAGDRIYGTE